MMHLNFTRMAVAVLLTAGVARPVHSETPEEFYKGKVLTFVVGSDPGGSFGVYAEILAQHMGKLIQSA